MWRILLLKETHKTLGFKGGGDTGHIRSYPDKVVCSSRESVGLNHSGKAADTFEKAWTGGCSSGNNCITITYLCVTIVYLEHDDWGRVGGSAAENSPHDIFILYDHYFQLN